MNRGNMPRSHTGSHPMTETKCDDPQCWCNAPSREVVTGAITEWRKCARCGMRVEVLVEGTGDEEYQKHLDSGECTRQLIYELVQSVHRMEENLRIVMEVIRGEEN